MRRRYLPGKRAVELELVSQFQFEPTQLNSTRWISNPTRAPLYVAASINPKPSRSTRFHDRQLSLLLRFPHRSNQSSSSSMLCFFRFFLNISIPDLVFKWLLTFVIEHTWRLRPTSFDGVFPYRLYVHCCFMFIIVLFMSFSEGGIP